jgi:undecaprenyl phosphate N,N'-diacetylbacillosamine 1-phosphate transferase
VRIYSKYFKRICDILGSLLLVTIFLPLILLICFFQILIYKRDVFYLQQRCGLRERVFILIKFRTMKDVYDSSGKLLPDSMRLTKFGKLLRFFSLDEIPNLVNVLSGHMSMVGPRPLPIRYLASMNKLQRNRYSVRPGITGLAQVSGRNELMWTKKISLDLVYVEKLSLLFDLKIIFKTLLVLFGANENKDIEEISFDNYEPNFKK